MSSSGLGAGLQSVQNTLCAQMEPGQALYAWTDDAGLGGVVRVAKGLLCGASSIRLSDIPGERAALAAPAAAISGGPPCLGPVPERPACSCVPGPSARHGPPRAPPAGFVDGSSAVGGLTLRSLGGLVTVRAGGGRPHAPPAACMRQLRGTAGMLALACTPPPRQPADLQLSAPSRTSQGQEGAHVALGSYLQLAKWVAANPAAAASLASNLKVVQGAP